MSLFSKKVGCLVILAQCLTPFYVFQHLIGLKLFRQADAVRNSLQMEVLKDKEDGILTIDKAEFLKRGFNLMRYAWQESSPLVIDPQIFLLSHLRNFG
ncbi:hypothetical protein NCS13_1_1545 [Neochlamydia sp. S13]|nr:hypothetical protein NCS13_1_1545 [Neochlamydia sp. S13]